MKRIHIRPLIVFAFALALLAADAQEALPKGLMLSLDFRNVSKGLVPNSGTFPLYVPTGDQKVEISPDNRYVLPFQENDTLQIPHSTLLDPDGSEWIVSARIYTTKDGIVLSQYNAQQGYVIRVVNGTVQVALRTEHSTIILKEDPRTGLTKCNNRWTTVELRIKPDMAFLLLNRKRAAMATLGAPLSGENMYLRLGHQPVRPSILKNIPHWKTEGFAGAFTSLKVIRQ